VSEALTKAQAEQLKLLRAAADGTLPKHIAQDMTEFSRDVLRELYDDGMLTGTKFQPIAGPAEFSGLKLTLRGRERLAKLEQLAVPDHAGNPAANVIDGVEDHSQKLLIQIAVGVTVIILGAFALYLFTQLCLLQ
jgi:hypothetical protein